MQIAATILGIASILELTIWLKYFNRLRKQLGQFLIVVILGSSGYVLFTYPRLLALIIFIFSCYRVFNLSRIVRFRMIVEYLKPVTLLSSLWLIVMQVVTLFLFLVLRLMSVIANDRWLVLAILQFLLILTLALSTLKYIRSTKEQNLSRLYIDNELPSLTVAIPARNETIELQACLQALIASDYPKLEILVLDDCSANPHTPDIIRSFAHDGVQFINGSEANTSWLAKNWAYQKLTDSSNGEIILFCGVDTRFSSDALRKLVTSLMTKNKSMLSVLPKNQLSDWRSLLIQPIRYSWELSLPRRIFQRPPTLSTCWLIKRSLLISAGGFKAVSRSIAPESYFARISAIQVEYAFIRSSLLTSVKPFSEQIATAVRTRYPQLHRKPEQVVALTIMEVIGLILPFMLLISSFIDGITVTGVIAAVSCTMAYLIYGAIIALTYGRKLWLGSLLMPLAIIIDIGLMHYSMFKYEFGEVIWKGRNICMPVMHIMSSLPKQRN